MAKPEDDKCDPHDAKPETQAFDTLSRIMRSDNSERRPANVTCRPLRSAVLFLPSRAISSEQLFRIATWPIIRVCGGRFSTVARSICLVIRLGTFVSLP